MPLPAEAPAPKQRSRILVGLLTLTAAAGALLVAGGNGASPAAAAATATIDTTTFSGAAERLAAALRIRTISHRDPRELDAQAFRHLHAYLQRTFPRVHRTLQRETVADLSLLYTWRGQDPSLPAILLAAHLDVVPVEAATADDWSRDPFGGEVADGFIWGRGALDNKSGVLGILEAVESLIAQGYQPTRTLVLAFGHDEEVGGGRGAAAIARTLEARGVSLELVLDEGGVIGNGVIPGVSAPTALIGIAEKGFATVELTARTAGGHSSLPPAESSIGVLSDAVSQLEDEQMPARLAGPARLMFERLGPEFPGVQRLLFANLWLTEPLVLRALERTPSTNAMVRTTTAVTIFESGTKDNVLPTEARAVVNFRILPGERVADVLNHVRSTVNDPRVSVQLAGAFSAEPSTVSSVDSRGYAAIERSLRAVSPDALATPFLVVVVTDARYYAPFSQDVFRFLPIALAPPDLGRIHGVDERLSIDAYTRVIQFYREFIRATTR